MRPTRNGANHAMTRRSLRTRPATLGRCTFTTTSSPVSKVAACTWAMEAAASGVRSKEANTSSRRAPRSASTTTRTVSNGSAGTWSRHFLNSFTSSAGNRPSPLEMIWPSLMYVGPSCSAALRSRKEISARLASGVAKWPRFLRTIHGVTAAESTRTTRTTRPPGGILPALVSAGTSACARARRSAANGSQRMASRCSVHGPSSVNAAQPRSSNTLMPCMIAAKLPTRHANDVPGDTGQR